MIEFNEEVLSPELLVEIHPLLVQHYEEIALYKDKIKLNPDYKYYRQMADIGRLCITTARKDKKLIGYSVNICMPHPHYKDHEFALNDVVYVHPDYRHGKASVGLFRFTERVLKNRGVSVHTLHMKVKAPFESFAEKLGYTKVEYNYSKYIGV